MLVFQEKLPKEKVVFVCVEALNQDKTSVEISLNFSLNFSLSFKGKVKRNLLTKISLMKAN